MVIASKFGFGSITLLQLLTAESGTRETTFDAAAAATAIWWYSGPATERKEALRAARLISGIRRAEAPSKYELVINLKTAKRYRLHVL